MYKLKFIPYLILQFILISMFISCRKQASGWKGTITHEDGVTIVGNPAKPIFEEEVLFLEEELSIGEPEGREEYLFENLWWLEVDGKEKIFAAEGFGNQVHIKVFDDKGEYLMTIGRSGQGPGEFGEISSMQITPDNELMVFDGRASKLTFFSLNGDYLRTVSMKGKMALGVLLNSRGDYIIIDAEPIPSNESEHFMIAMLAAVFSPDFKFIRTITKDKFRSPIPFQTWMMPKFQPPDEVVCGHKETYKFHFYDKDGGLTKIVGRDFEPIAISEKDKEKYQDSDVEIPNFYPAFEDFSVDEEGRLFVKTHEKSSDGNKPVYDLFDTEGRYIAQAFLPALPKFWKNGKMYTIEEDDTGFLYIKRYKVTLQ